ncbi:MAG: hypothetical protein ACK5LJ_02055 [Paracoccus sp. (in: a-proteobacteria)]
MTRPILTAALLLSALPALAQNPASQAAVDGIAPISDIAPEGDATEGDAIHMACSFARECIDNECQDSGYEGRLTIITDGAGLAEAEWADPSETVSMSAEIDSGNVFARSGADDASLQRILTVLDSGDARYTSHLGAPLMAITYIGSCEVTP